MWIENIGAADCQQGFHYDCGENSMLIQISDPDSKDCELYTTAWFPEPHHKFKEVHQFMFLDIEGDSPHAEKWGCTDAHAAELVRLLQHALDTRMNVVVHCFAGICRSGAVVEVGVMMGFIPTERGRIPNTRVKTKMMKVLGLTYDSAPNVEPSPMPRIYFE
jgi:protein tyrosine phosphatase